MPLLAWIAHRCETRLASRDASHYIGGMSKKDRQDAWRARGGSEADVILSVPVHRWALSDLLVQQGFMRLLDRGERTPLTSALTEYLSAQYAYGRSTG